MKRFAKLDANHNAIVKGLRDIPGVSVQSLATIGGGCPDLLIGYGNLNFLVEIKDGAKPPSARTLTDAERRFCKKWNGQYRVCETVGECCTVIGYPLKGITT